MATTFDVTTYPLSSKTTQEDKSAREIDYLDDGTPKVRLLGTTHRSIVRCVWESLPEATMVSLRNYIRTNLATEFDLAVSNETYRGYFIGDARVSESNGTIYSISAEFLGVIQ